MTNNAVDGGVGVNTPLVDKLEKRYVAMFRNAIEDANKGNNKLKPIASAELPTRKNLEARLNVLKDGNIEHRYQKLLSEQQKQDDARYIDNYIRSAQSIIQQMALQSLREHKARRARSALLQRGKNSMDARTRGSVQNASRSRTSTATVSTKTLPPSPKLSKPKTSMSAANLPSTQASGMLSQPSRSSLSRNTAKPKVNFIKRNMQAVTDPFYYFK